MRNFHFRKYVFSILFLWSFGESEIRENPSDLPAKTLFDDESASAYLIAQQSHCNFTRIWREFIPEIIFCPHTATRDIFYIALAHAHSDVGEIFPRREFFFAHFWDLWNAGAGGCLMADGRG